MIEIYFSQIFLILKNRFHEVEKINITSQIYFNVSENRYPKYENYSKQNKKKKPGIFARLVFFYKNAKRILKIANKPNRKDYFTVFKICAIGIVILGALSYVIQLIFAVVNEAIGV